ncbi:MAG TPA: AAA family ATPase [Pyrinomonadaceae bacterium]|nr:AAA family ATPase [Pyrinomonadaceae bacterium]
MSTSAPIDTMPPFFKSLSALRRAHTSLLEEYQEYDDDKDENIPTASFFEQVETFLSRASKTGSVLDIDEDRSDAQALLNYWTTVLYESGESPRPTLLAKFDEELVSREIGSGCPYRGLRAFHKEDRAVFYGRRQLTRDMTKALGSGNFLAVIGLSGSGKSSIVRAGLIPALQEGALTDSESWNYYDPIVPGPEPIRSLAELARPAEVPAEQWYRSHVAQFKNDDAHLLKLMAATGQTAVIIVDQFEELFTLSRDDAERQAFVANLVQLTKASDPRHILIITMRSEFDTYVARYPELQELFDSAQVRVPPLSPQDLRKAIEKPAERSGLSFEAGLVEELVQEVLGEPAGLPLLQFTLYKLWENRDGKNITRAIYDQLGGSPREILAGVANATYESFRLTEDRNISRRIMLRLVRPGAGLDVTNNRVRRATLSSVGARDNVDRVLGVWVTAGLLRVTPGATRDDDQVEVMHEALIRNWPLLVAWLEEERVHLRKRLQLTSAAQQWAEHKRDPGGLLGGSLLAEAKNYDHLNPLETEFLEASQRAADAATQYERDQLQKLAHEQEERANQKGRAARYFRFLAISLAFLLVVAVVAAIAVGSKSREAQKERDDALKEKSRAENLRIRAEAYRIDAEGQRDKAETALALTESEKKRAESETLKAQEANRRLHLAADTEIRLRKEREDADRRAQSAQDQADEASDIAQIAKVSPLNIIKTSSVLGLRGFVRPLRPGASISSTSTTAGSLCCIVRDPSGQNYLLSMSYTISGKIGDSILQPSVFDGGTEKNKVAVLSSIDSGKTAALARLLPGIEFTNEIPGVGKIKGLGPPVKVGDVVILVGRTSGAVRGRVTTINAIVQVQGPDGPITLRDVIFAEKISNPGDGGAPVLDEQGRLVGIHWGGSDKTSIFIPIERILREFNVELVP